MAEQQRAAFMVQNIHFDVVDDEAEESPDASGEDDDEVPALPKPALCRYQTHDSFEQTHDWKWVMPDGAEDGLNPPDLQRLQTQDVFEQQPNTQVPMQPRMQPEMQPPMPPMPQMQPQVMQPMMQPMMQPQMMQPQMQGQMPMGMIPQMPNVIYMPVAVPQGMMVQPASEARGMRWPSGQDGAPPPDGILVGGQGDATVAMPVTPPHESPLEAPPPMVPPQPGLTRAFSVNSQLYRVNWTLPDKKLRSSDKGAVSPQIELPGGVWRLQISAVQQHAQRSGGSFKASKGFARIQLKREQPGPDKAAQTLMFRFFAGKGEPRGPHTYDFDSGNSVVALPENGIFDLNDGVENKTVTIGAEITVVAA